MKAPVWTPEKLKALTRNQLEQLRDNAKRLSNSELAANCDAQLATRAEPKRAARTPSRRASETDVVVGYHFVCQADRVVQVKEDGTFWSGSWVVSEQNVQTSLRYGAYLALHASKTEPSYRQGKIVDFRKTSRSMVARNEDGIEFKVQSEATPYHWVGAGAGEKGYKWSKLATCADRIDQQLPRVIQ
jgi:hypothetical protein